MWAKGSYETFDHIADIGVRGFGPTLAEAFANGARAMFTVMFDETVLEQVRPIVELHLKCDSYDKVSLFVEWLNALLTRRDLEEMVFTDFSIHVADDGLSLSAVVKGEPLDHARHTVLTEVKAATYSQMMLKDEGSEGPKRFMVQCIVDV